jgi:hypothetical protein
MFPAVSAALDALGPREGVRYYDVVLAALPSAARVRWEAFMTTDVRREYHSELFRELAARHEALGEAAGEARGEARGVARGEGRAVITVLEARGVAVPDVVRERVMACTDVDQLDTWLRRAVTANTADEVVHD